MESLYEVTTGIFRGLPSKIGTHNPTQNLHLKLRQKGASYNGTDSLSPYPTVSSSTPRGTLLQTGVVKKIKFKTAAKS